MKKLLVAMIILIIAIGCGAPEGGKAEKKTTGKEEISYYAKLTESELQTYMKVLPVFKAEIDKHGKELKQLDMKEGPGAWANYYAWAMKEYGFLDGALRKAGMGLEEFLKTHSKVAMAFASLFVKEGMAQQKSMTDEMEKKLNDPSIGKQQKEMIKQQLEAMKQGIASADSMFEKIPSENIELISKYKDDLMKLFKSLQ